MASSAGAPKQKITEADIVNRFNQLRQEQQQFQMKLAELEGDKKEHGLVIDAMKDLDGDRKCFRLIGGVLVERTVKEVLPALRNNQKGLEEIIKNLAQQTVAKGKEINEMKEKFNIKIKGEEGPGDVGGAGKAANAGVLV
eukprot:Nk52_evm19s2356 gene=Nk52_evmTU19s2356